MALTIGVSLMVAAHGVAANGSKVSPKNPQAFGTLRAVIDTIDYLDPQQAYTGQSWWAMWNVYETLLTYQHVDGPAGYKLVPGLAQSLPTVSRNGKVYKFKLRKGLKYSNGAAVKASDFEWAIKRGFLAQGQGVGFYTDIAGAEAYSKNPTPGGDISGIVTNNAKRTITIKLVSPRGDFLTILALIFAAPVPGGTDPAIQNGTIPGTGPYKFTNYDPNRSFTMARNPYFKPTKYIHKGNPNTIDVQLVGDADAATQRVINGQADYSNAAIPPDRIADAKSKGKLLLRKTANTYYFWMNIKEPPFNKLKVRQAVNWAIDRKALQTLVWGGLGRPTENVLPPTYPSYKKHNLYPYNLKKAKQLVAASGDKGMSVTVWNHDRGTDPKATAYLVSVLNSIGFKAKEKIINSAVYWTTVGNQATKAQIGFADWFQDYPHPLDWFDVLLNGDRITQTHNNNYSNFDDSAVNSKIESLKKQPTMTSSVNAQWAALDQQIMQQAPWVPFMNRQFTDFFNSDMDLSCYVNHVLYQFDFALICKK